jgi:hypothetical protein
MKYLAKPMYALMIITAGVAGYILYQLATGLVKALLEGY